MLLFKAALGVGTASCTNLVTYTVHHRQPNHVTRGRYLHLGTSKVDKPDKGNNLGRLSLAFESKSAADTIFHVNCDVSRNVLPSATPTPRFAVIYKRRRIDSDVDAGGRTLHSVRHK